MTISADYLITSQAQRSQSPREFYPAINDNAAEGRRCRKCGCTDWSACVDDDGTACHWVAPDLCSACDPVSPAMSAETVVGQHPSSWALPAMEERQRTFWSELPAGLAFYALLCVIAVICFWVL